MKLYGFEKSDPALFDLVMVQKEVDGGRTDSVQTDRIQKHPEAESLIVSGLDQEAFEYLIRRFGRQFKTISFWKNKMICDLSPLSGLPELQYVHFFFNQRVSDLWDMRDNVCLRELNLPAGGFRLEELARLRAEMPGIRGTVTQPYSESTVIRQGEETTWYFLCKGRKRLLKGRDEEKLKAYLEEFDHLVERYRSEAG